MPGRFVPVRRLAARPVRRDRLRRCACRTCSAAPGLEVGIADDAWLEFGPGTIDERVARLGGLGVRGRARDASTGGRIEPEQGALDWTHADALARGAPGRGHRASRRHLGDPGLGERRRAARTCRPARRRRFATFARAAAQRYPWVRRWIVWNEPNQRRWLMPPSPTVYVTKLLNPGGGGDQVGDPRRDDRRRRDGAARRPRRHVAGRLHPRAWDARVRGSTRTPTIRTRSRRPRRRARAAARSARRSRMATLDRLLKETRIGVRAAHTGLAQRARLPDQPARSGARRDLGEAGALRRRGAVARVRRRPRRSPVQYLVRDEPRLDAWQSGLETVAGRAKPALDAFALPLAQVGRERADDDGLGPGSHGQRSPSLPAPAPCRRPLGVARRRDARPPTARSRASCAPHRGRCSGCSTRRPDASAPR